MKPSFSFLYGEYRYGSEQLFPALDAHSQGEFRAQVDAGLTVTLTVRRFAGLDAVEWLLHFENLGTENSKIIADICDCDGVLPLPTPGKPRSGHMPEQEAAFVTAMNGMVPGHYYHADNRVSATEYELRPEYLGEGSCKRYENTCGRSSDGWMPFFEVSVGEEGAILAIGWTGTWRAAFENEGGRIRARSGLQKTGFYLEGGERVRTSSVLVMRYGKGEDASNKFRRLMREHFSPVACRGAGRNGLLAFELWGGLPSEVMIQRLKELKEQGLRYEDAWIDAGWYGESPMSSSPFEPTWAQNTGDWRVSRKVHPHGLEDVRDAAQEAGMRLMLWFEPERCCSNMPAVAAHPEWFISCNPEHKGADSLLWYGHPEAKRYAREMLEQHIRTLNLSCYRQDFNIPLQPCTDRHDGPGRVGISEIRHICGMYEIWDGLLETFPGLMIDNCSSGGRRFDIETLRRSIPFFRSDYQCQFNADPDVTQVHNSGAARYMPFTGCTTKAKPEPYALRSTYAASWGVAFYNSLLQTADERDFAMARRLCEEYRAIRRYFPLDFYNHGSRVYDKTAWAIWQYADPECREGVVLAFRREQSPQDRAVIELKGLEAGVELEVYCFDTGKTFDSGRELSIELPEKRSCMVLTYRVK